LMRRLLTAILWMTVLTLLLVGCEGEGQTLPRLTPAPSPTPFPADTPISSRVQARGYLIVGVRYDLRPFCYVDESGSLAGFDIELGRELAHRWMGDPNAVQFRQVRSDTAATRLRSGEIDLALAGLIHSSEMEELVDFGPSYFVDGHALLVRTTDEFPINTPSDIEGRIVGAVVGSDAEDMLRGVIPFTPTMQYYNTFEQASAALANGEIDAISDLRRRLVRGLSDVPNTTIVGQHTEAVVGAAFAHNDPGWADLVVLAFHDMAIDGTFAGLYSDWFGSDPPPNLQAWPGATPFSLEQAGQAQAVHNTLAEVRAGGWLQVAMVADTSPFAYLDATGTPTGYEVRLIRTLAQRWLGDPTAVEFIYVTREDGLRMVSNGEVDMLIGLVPHTRETELQVDFSLTTYIAGEGLMVNVNTAPADLTGLNGQTVATVLGTNSANVLQQVGQALGISVVAFPKGSLEEAISSLEAGEVLAVMGERTDMLAPAYAIPGLAVTSDRLTEVPIGIALPPGDSELRDLVNLTLQAMHQEGQFTAIYAEWFDDGPPRFEAWPGAPTRPLRVEVFPQQ
jgi:ABC-type amino acid transport substrate-binding protein